MRKFLFILGITTFFFLSSQKVSAASLNLSSSTATPKVGEEFWVEVNLNTQIQETLGTDAVLIFDPQLFEAKEIEEGEIYPDYPGKKIDNEQGKIFLSGVANYGSSVSASGVLGKIKFVPKKEGKAQISFAWQSGKTNLTSIIPYQGNADLLNQPPQSLSLQIEKQTLMGKIIEFIRRLVSLFPF